MADASATALSKVGDALPKKLRPAFEDKRFRAKLPWKAPKPKVDLAVIRRAVKNKARLKIDYVNEDGRRSQRVINPLELRICPPWVVIAWCEEREDVRMFRVDRIKSIEVSDSSEAPRACR